MPLFQIQIQLYRAGQYAFMRKCSTTSKLCQALHVFSGGIVWYAPIPFMRTTSDARIQGILYMISSVAQFK